MSTFCSLIYLLALVTFYDYSTDLLDWLRFVSTDKCAFCVSGAS